MYLIICTFSVVKGESLKILVEVGIIFELVFGNISLVFVGRWIITHIENGVSVGMW